MRSSVFCVSTPSLTALRRFLLTGLLLTGLLLTGLISPAWAGSVTNTYDTLGRITQATYTTGGLGTCVVNGTTFTTCVVIAYVYDAAGNRSSYVISGAP